MYIFVNVSVWFEIEFIMILIFLMYDASFPLVKRLMISATPSPFGGCTCGMVLVFHDLVGRREKSSVRVGICAGIRLFVIAS